MTTFEKVYKESKIILTEGALVERLKTEFDVEIDSYINHAGLIYTNPEILEMLYKQYVDIAQKHNLPIMIMTPTRKVNFESIKNSKFHDKNIIDDACLFLSRIKESYVNYSHQIMIGGLLGCKRDAYKSSDSLDVKTAYTFHRTQVIQFDRQNIDFLFAGIMPEINEAEGMAQAIAETEIPYIISFMIRKNGCLIDGTPISEAIKIIDSKVSRKPICYMVNCVHPKILNLALITDKNQNQQQYLPRLKGIQANASMLSPEELNNCKTLQQEDFNIIISEMELLYHQFDFKIFGGCCGTNDMFIEKLASQIKRWN